MKLPEGFIPLPGKLLLSTRAISNRCNDNGDFFSKEELLGSFEGKEPHNERYGYRTFIGKPVFLDHNNTVYDDPRGRIIVAQNFHDLINVESAKYPDFTEVEDDDTWIKNFFEVDADRYPLTASAVKLGFIKSTSMGCDIEYSICSICANRAKYLFEYCNHISDHKMSKKFSCDHEDGIERLAYEKNYGLQFFEDSLLTVPPADPTADILQVQASSEGIDLEGMLNNIRKEEHSTNDGLELCRQPGESVDSWIGRRQGIAKSAFSTQVAVGADLDHGTDLINNQEESGTEGDDSDKVTDTSEGPPVTPTSFSDLEPYKCPATNQIINPEACQGCQFNAAAGDLVANTFPEISKPDGRDPKVYEEESPPGGMSANSYKLISKNSKVYVRHPSGRLALYGSYNGDNVNSALDAEMAKNDFEATALNVFNRIDSLGRTTQEHSKEVTMTLTRVADDDRVKVARSQIERIQDPAKRAEFLKSLGAEPSDPSVDNDPRDLDSPHVNVKDKGMATPPPAPPGETPDDNDKGTGKVDVTQVPSVEDKGLQTPIRDNPAPDVSSTPTASNQVTPEMAVRARAARARAAGRRPVRREASPENDGRIWAAFDLVDRQITAGVVDPSERNTKAREIATSKSEIEIKAQIEAIDSVTSVRTASRPLVPQAAETETDPQMSRPVASRSRSIPSRTASSSGQSRDELALSTIGSLAGS